jgi:hypothetical protein
MSEVKTNKITSLASNNDITLEPDGTGVVNLADDNKLTFGTGSDLEIFHDGSNSNISDVGTGQLVLRTDGTQVAINKGSSENMAKFIADGAVELYHDNTLKFQTHASGATVGNTSSSGANNGLLIINNGGTGDAMLRFDYENNGDRARIGTTTSGQQLEFYTAGDNERMRISSDGALLVGGTSAVINSDSKLGVHGRIDASASGTTPLSLNRSGSDGVIIDFLNDGSAGIGNVSVSGSNVAFNTSSDYRLKEAVVDMTGAIDRVKQLAPKRFNFIRDADKVFDGFLAHEAQAVVPEAVTGTKDEVDDDGNAVMQGIDQSKLVPLLCAALKESIAKIETLETKVAALEAGE